MAFNIEWDKMEDRLYETGIDRGTLYPYNKSASTGATPYDKAIAWSGLTGFTESPEGAEATDLYADNIKYLSMLSAENLKGTLEAYTYPDEFMACDGTANITDGVVIGQQEREMFGFSYRTQVQNAPNSLKNGYKIHCIYGAKASPSEKAYATINDSPDAITFSWEISTTPVNVTGKKPTASVTIDCSKLTDAQVAAIESALYGDGETVGKLPLPDEIVTIINGAAGKG